MTNLCLQIAVPVPLYQCFDYWLPEEVSQQELIPGLRVQIPFGKRRLIGILVATTTAPSVVAHSVRPALQILDHQPLFSPTVLQLIHWASAYYHHPLGEVFASALPSLLRKGKPAKVTIKEIAKLEKLISAYSADEQNITLTSVQQQAVSSVLAQRDRFQTFLLEGVTGSGKTEVYLQVIAQLLDSKKQALVLVPEINLTPQLLARFKQRFPKACIVVLHSNLSERQRLSAWLLAQQGKADIIIGTRSAIFTPLAKPGIIIVDEEHDASFKQQEGFRYQARDLALKRGQLENIPVILGSATPSFETLYNVQRKRYFPLYLPLRVGVAQMPKFQLLDIRNQTLENGISVQLRVSMQQHLRQGGQVLLFLNRRGYAPVLFCSSCQWVASCQRCAAKLTYHQQPPSLQCHHCGAQHEIYEACLNCKRPHLIPLGLGTQRLESTLRKYFPEFSLVRIDRDSTRNKGRLENVLADIQSGQSRILVGTQMLAKGHHFPDVSLVAVLNADQGLYSTDFRGQERVAQLLIQVAGRAGRADRPGEVVVQTYNPEHPALVKLIHEGYSSFATHALLERQREKWPPFSYLALFHAEAVSQKFPMEFLQALRKLACTQAREINLLGPAPALIARKAGRFRAQLLLHSNSRIALHNLLRYLINCIAELPNLHRVRWTLDVDPAEM